MAHLKLQRRHTQNQVCPLKSNGVGEYANQMRYRITESTVLVRPMIASKGMSCMRSLMERFTAPPVAWKKEPWGRESTTVAPAWIMAAASSAETPAPVRVGAKV